MSAQTTEPVFNLFSGKEGFEEANEMVNALNARKRGPYNKNNNKIPKCTLKKLIRDLYQLKKLLKWKEQEKEINETVDITGIKYAILNKLYEIVGEIYPIRICENEDRKTIYDGGVKSWYFAPYVWRYEYEGKQYEESVERSLQAEIIGTENFDIDDRIYLHEKLINLHQNRTEMSVAVKLIQQDIKELQKKYKISEYAQWLKKQRI